ncbi:glutathione S-transferase [Novosphingobium sp. FSY-8]|uniref:Glutathione S-transferase n=1 Tax=Novosphingobium ovatum TaxID=1908523 RepID=A0ABW9XAZ3_9SPHN|nr:glutathione S-transferase family protein [Novosphingobium ovatum]NBC35672.1 glutathione S-transferase [Novosphingobium ovatum]
MADYTFFTNPMSRGQIARWALHEVGADYATVIVAYDQPRPPALLAANAMGKLPTLIHHTAGGDYPLAEGAAICAYLAQTEGDGALAPTAQERAAYYRWLFFAAGPVEQAITARSMGFEPTERQQMSAGFGSYDRVVDCLAGHFAASDFVCGARFTMADVYVGSQVLWGLAFGTLPDHPAFAAYAARLVERPAYAAAKAIDDSLIRESATT